MVDDGADIATHAADPVRGEPRVTVILTTDPLDVGRAHEDVADPACGGTTVFSGAVRDHHRGDAVTHLEYEAWEERAEVELHAVAQAVLERHTGVRAIHLAHRLGPLAIGDVSVVVAASAPHRDEAFAAARAGIDRLKAQVPIWKHEFLADGRERWPDGHEPTSERTVEPTTEAR